MFQQIDKKKIHNFAFKCFLYIDLLLITLPSCMQVSDDDNTVMIEFTPTIPHCSMATLIGLSIRVKLLRALPSRFKVHCFIHLYHVYCCRSPLLSFPTSDTFCCLLITLQTVPTHTCSSNGQATGASSGSCISARFC